MSQRNPMNDRYTTERTGGATRQGAGSMKPASKAGASVRTESSKKKTAPRRGLLGGAADTRTKEEKKAEQQRRRQEEDTLYTASTVLLDKDPKYRKFRRIWWVLLVMAATFTVVAMLTVSTAIGDSPLTIAILVLAYASIIAALVLDFTVVRKRRNECRQKVVSMSKRQVDKLLTDSYVERRAKDEAKRAAKAARKAGADPEAAAKAASDEVFELAAQGTDGYNELVARANAQKAQRKVLFGRSKATSSASAAGSDTAAGAAAGTDGTGGAPGTAAADGSTAASGMSTDEEAAREAAAKAAREYALSRRSGTRH